MGYVNASSLALPRFGGAYQFHFEKQGDDETYHFLIGDPYVSSALRKATKDHRVRPGHYELVFMNDGQDVLVLTGDEKKAYHSWVNAKVQAKLNDPSFQRQYSDLPPEDQRAFAESDVTDFMGVGRQEIRSFLGQIQIRPIPGNPFQDKT